MEFLKISPLKRVFTFLKKIIQTKYIILLSLCLFFIGASTLLYKHYKDIAYQFYPIESSPSDRLLRTYSLFNAKEYSTLTSYIEQQLLDRIEDKEHYDLLFFQAESYFQMQQYSIAKNKFQLLYKQSPKYWQALLRLAVIDFLDNKTEEFLSQINLVPPSYEKFYWLGCYSFKQKEYLQALEYFLKADRKDKRTLLALGETFYNTHNYTRAIENLQYIESIFLEERKKILSLLFFSSAELNKQAYIIKYSNALVPFLDKDKSLTLQVAQKLLDLKEYQQAKIIYLSFIDSYQKIDKDIIDLLLQVLYVVKEYTEVIYYAPQATANYKNLLLLIYSYYYTHQYVNTAQYIQDYFERYGDNLSQEDKNTLLLMQAESYEKNNQFFPAIMVREKINQDNFNKENSYQLILLYSKTKQEQKAIDLVRKVFIEYKNELPDLVDLLISMKQYKTAQDILTEGLDKEPENEIYLLAQARLYFIQDKIELLNNILYQLSQLDIKDPLLQYKVYYALGSIALHNRHYLDAQAFLEKAKFISNTKGVNLKLLLVYSSLNNKNNLTKLIQEIKHNKEMFNSLTTQELEIFKDISK